MRKSSKTLLVVGLVALSPLAAMAQEPPKVKIPEPGVPQIMTMEGRYVRAAYNNEGYAILGYKLANLSVGEEWMLLGGRHRPPGRRARLRPYPRGGVA